MVGRGRRGLLGLPGLTQAGLLVFALGSALDLLYHTVPATWTGTLDGYLGEAGAFAHLVTFAGMVLTMLGVLLGRVSHGSYGRRARAQSPVGPHHF